MFLYFDKEGTLKTKIDHGEKLRQGGDMNVTVCLDTDFWSSKKRGDYSLELNALLMTLVFPDETKPCWEALNWLQKHFSNRRLGFGTSL